MCQKYNVNSPKALNILFGQVISVYSITLAHSKTLNPKPSQPTPTSLLYLFSLSLSLSHTQKAKYVEEIRINSGDDSTA